MRRFSVSLPVDWLTLSGENSMTNGVRLCDKWRPLVPEENGRIQFKCSSVDPGPERHEKIAAETEETNTNRKKRSATASNKAAKKAKIQCSGTCALETRGC